MKKNFSERQKIILNKFADRNINKKDRNFLRKLAVELGISTSQIYRDFGELGIKRVNGVYQLPSQLREKEREEQLGKVLREYGVPEVLDADVILLRTEKGLAGFIGQEMRGALPNDILGIIAGEDLLLIVHQKDIDKKRKITGFLKSVGSNGALEE